MKNLSINSISDLYESRKGVDSVSYIIDADLVYPLEKERVSCVIYNLLPLYKEGLFAEKGGTEILSMAKEFNLKISYKKDESNNKVNLVLFLGKTKNLEPRKVYGVRRAIWKRGY